MLSELTEARVEFLLIGDICKFASHGFPLATGDLDLWVRPEPGNAVKVYGALTRFGSPLYELSVEDFSTPDLVFQIGR